MAKTVHYEFGGPIGALGVIIGLPVVIYGLYFLCNGERCLDFHNMSSPQFWSEFQSTLPSSLSDLVTSEAAHMYLGWMLFHVILERILPGETVEGVELPNKKRLKYTMSGHLQFWLTIVAMGHAYPILEAATATASTGKTCCWTDALLKQVYKIRGFASLPISMVYDHYLGLITVSVIFTFLFSVYL